MNWKNPQTGTYNIDHYREGQGLAAANVLKAGMSTNTKSGDHNAAGELCVEVIVRLGKNMGARVADQAVHDSCNRAIDNLQRGNGFHKVQADHAGGNTCAAVIAAATA